MSSEKEQLARQKVIQKKQEQSGPGSQKDSGGGVALNAGDMQALQGMVGNTAVGQLGQIQRAPQDGERLEHASSAAYGSILGRGAQAGAGNGASIQRMPSNADWQNRSSKMFHKRSPELQGIDAALRTYNQRKNNDGITNQEKVSLLSNIQDQILEWKKGKQNQATGDFESKRLSNVEWLEDQIEDKRKEVEQGIADGITEAPIDTDFSDLAVYSMGTVSDYHDFIDETKQKYDETKGNLEQANAPASDVDIRIAMLSEKVQEAHAHMEAQKGEDEHKNKKVIGLFTAAEWFFKRPYAPYTESDKMKIINAVRSLSSTYKNLLIVPGSIMWGEGRGDDAALHNTTVALMNGQLVHETNKHKEGIDIVNYTRTLQGTKANPLLKKRAQEWGRGGGRMKEGGVDYGPEKPQDSASFTVGGLSMSLEICGDHDAQRALTEMREKNVQPQDGAHVQILVSAGSKLTNSVMRPDGIAVNTDASKTRDSKKGERSVRVGGIQDDNEKVNFTGSDDLAKLFMGIYKLPR